MSDEETQGASTLRSEEAALRSRIQRTKRLVSARGCRARELERMLDKCLDEEKALRMQVEVLQLELVRLPPLTLLHARVLYRASQSEVPLVFSKEAAEPLVGMLYLKAVRPGTFAHQGVYTLTPDGLARLRKDYPDGNVPGVRRLYQTTSQATGSQQVAAAT